MTQITEDLVSYGTAITLKEKKFDVPVKNYYSIYTESTKYNLQKKYGAKKNWNSFDLTISRPPQSLVMKWLREVHKIFIDVDIDPIGFGEEPYYTIITDISTCSYITGRPALGYKTYEEACEAAIKYCLENLI